MDDLAITAVSRNLATLWVGRTYEYVETVTSTNDVLKKRAAELDEAALPEGTVLVADYQSRGRGRLGRRWEALPGTSLMLSLLLRPQWPVCQSLWLTMIAGLAAAEAIESLTNLSVSLKWPNDVGLELDGVWHKLGGVLVEGNVAQNGRLQYAVLGMGLNVNMTAAQLPEGRTPVTSVLVAGGQRVERCALLVSFLAGVESWYETAVAGQSPVSVWEKRLVTIGRQVTVKQADKTLSGMAVGVDDWGQLKLSADDGSLHLIAAGDVTLRT
ncbi:MAG: biotin--[acetyl-CoA-carboxylase] ligase [Chloroflexi bacterium]|nr:MAG: biotin--[acetyl-CoA-carboxylase] ligase [Chloroflexota bacterium]